ncbi:MAG: hypothetical protein QOH04_2 [Sphingomonadales bacterium]|jgi:hypothetical protein|nr:hypothetical protein [Sphingomonadales bacterium]
MAPYPFDVDSDAPYSLGSFREETDDLFHYYLDGCRCGRRIIFELKAHIITRNRAIARLPFSWVT